MSVFKELSEKKPESTIEKTVKYPEQDILKWINEKRLQKKSSICALLIGHPKSGKTGVVLDSRTQIEKEQHKKVIMFELNSDHGCDVNKKEHHNNDEDIIILNPREYSIDKNGDWQPDYILTMAKIKAAIQTIKNNFDELNVAVIGFDGLDAFLSEICESQMRIDENIDAAGGVSQRYWKNRNKFYYDVINMLFDIDCDKYFITHYGERRRDEKTGEYSDDRTVSKLDKNLIYSCQKSTADKMHQIVEFMDETKVIKGKPVVKLTATIISDRRNLNRHMEKVIIAESDENGKIIWHGLKL